MKIQCNRRWRPELHLRALYQIWFEILFVLFQILWAFNWACLVLDGWCTFGTGLLVPLYQATLIECIWTIWKRTNTIWTQGRYSHLQLGFGPWCCIQGNPSVAMCRMLFVVSPPPLAGEWSSGLWGHGDGNSGPGLRRPRAALRGAETHLLQSECHSNHCSISFVWRYQIIWFEICCLIYCLGPCSAKHDGCWFGAHRINFSNVSFFYWKSSERTSLFRAISDSCLQFCAVWTRPRLPFISD